MLEGVFFESLEFDQVPWFLFADLGVTRTLNNLDELLGDSDIGR